MTIVIGNYLALLLALVLPTLGFPVLDLPRVATSIVAFGSLGLILVIIACLAWAIPDRPGP